MPKFVVVDDINSITLSNDWTNASTFKSKNRIVDKHGKFVTQFYQGHQYQLIAKKERYFSSLETFSRILLGTLIVISSFGTALFSRTTQNLFTKKKEVRRFGIKKIDSEAVLCRFTTNEVLEEALKCKRVAEMYKNLHSINIYGKQPWSIKIVDKSIIEFEAKCNYPKHQIELRSDLSKEQAISYFIFEIINGLHQAHFDDLHKQALKDLDCETYVKEIERIEHHGILLHQIVIQSGIQENGWKKSMNIYANTDLDFERRWQQIKNSSHADYYRKAWHNYLCHRNYC